MSTSKKSGAKTAAARSSGSSASRARSSTRATTGAAAAATTKGRRAASAAPTSLLVKRKSTRPTARTDKPKEAPLKPLTQLASVEGDEAVPALLRGAEVANVGEQRVEAVSGTLEAPAKRVRLGSAATGSGEPAAEAEMGAGVVGGSPNSGKNKQVKNRK